MAYHDKRYPHLITARINEEQYNKIKGNVSETIRNLINNYENHSS